MSKQRKKINCLCVGPQAGFFHRPFFVLSCLWYHIFGAYFSKNTSEQCDITSKTRQKKVDQSWTAAVWKTTWAIFWKKRKKQQKTKKEHWSTLFCLVLLVISHFWRVIFEKYEWKMWYHKQDKTKKGRSSTRRARLPRFFRFWWPVGHQNLKNRGKRALVKSKSLALAYSFR